MFLVLTEKIYLTLQTVFYQISKLVEVFRKWSATRCTLNSLLDVWKKLGFPFLIYYVLNEQYFLMQSPSERKIRLSGYGVELAVKKTEYKAVDDSKVQDDTEGEVQKTDEADDDEVEGFLFGKLRFV